MEPTPAVSSGRSAVRPRSRPERASWATSWRTSRLPRRPGPASGPAARAQWRRHPGHQHHHQLGLLAACGRHHRDLGRRCSGRGNDRNGGRGDDRGDERNNVADDRLHRNEPVRPPWLTRIRASLTPRPTVGDTPTPHRLRSSLPGPYRRRDPGDTGGWSHADGPWSDDPCRRATWSLTSGSFAHRHAELSGVAIRLGAAHLDEVGHPGLGVEGHRRLEVQDTYRPDGRPCVVDARVRDWR